MINIKLFLTIKEIEDIFEKCGIFGITNKIKSVRSLEFVKRLTDYINEDTNKDDKNTKL